MRLRHNLHARSSVQATHVGNLSGDGSRPNVVDGSLFGPASIPYPPPRLTRPPQPLVGSGPYPGPWPARNRIPNPAYRLPDPHPAPPARYRWLGWCPRASGWTMPPPARGERPSRRRTIRRAWIGPRSGPWLFVGPAWVVRRLQAVPSPFGSPQTAVGGRAPGSRCVRSQDFSRPIASRSHAVARSTIA